MMMLMFLSHTHSLLEDLNEKRKAFRASESERNCDLLRRKFGVSSIGSALMLLFSYHVVEKNIPFTPKHTQARAI